ncbi:MAG: 3-deoxy-D-manno-octulosonic acid transferase [Chitinophagaceae bacterium]
MQLLFYSFFLVLYRLGISLASGFNSKARSWITGRKFIFTHLKESIGQNNAPLIWMHCASLGEFEQGRPLLEAIRKKYPSYKLLVTFFSPSGFDIIRSYKGVDYIFYLPLDSKKNARKFLEITEPKLVLWIKYDYWYFYLSTLKQKNIPTLLISGTFRIEQPFFKWYGKLHISMLDCFKQIFVQTQASIELLKSIGFSQNIIASGDTRFDRVLEIASKFEPIEGLNNFCKDHLVVVAGSTWIEDEEELDHYANSYTNIKFIIAPHEVSELRLKEIEKLFTRCVRYSEIIRANGPIAITPVVRTETLQIESRDINKNNPAGNSNVLLIDNIGMLSRLYRYATIAYIGGGFGNDGVHNVLEAAVYGKPVIFGPVYEKYKEAIELLEAGAAYSIETALELEELMNNMLSDEEWLKESGNVARNYVREKAGATEVIMNYIHENRLLTS